MRASALFADYERRRGNLSSLYAAVADAIPVQRALYPGSYIDVCPSFVIPDVTYVDTDRRARAFFADRDAVQALVADRQRYQDPATIAFHPVDYTTPLPLPDQSVDLLISLYAGFISPACTRYLRPRGFLLVNDSHGDASMAFLDPEYTLCGVIDEHEETYRLETASLEDYFQMRKPTDITVELLRERGRGPTYRKQAEAYLFQRTVPTTGA